MPTNRQIITRLENAWGGSGSGKWPNYPKPTCVILYKAYIALSQEVQDALDGCMIVMGDYENIDQWVAALASGEMIDASTGRKDANQITLFGSIEKEDF